jgi:TRAP-type C4-dicarboxylate transport system permease small subunit
MGLKRLKSILDSVLEVGTVIATFGIILTVTIQAFARLCLPVAPAWTEEGARMCFIFSVAFAAGLAVRDHAFVKVDTLLRVLPTRYARILRLVTHLAIMLLMITVSAFALDFIRVGRGQRSPCLQIPMAGVHAALLLLSVMVALYTALEIVQGARDFFFPERDQ